MHSQLAAEKSSTARKLQLHESLTNDTLLLPKNSGNEVKPRLHKHHLLAEVQLCVILMAAMEV